MAEHGSDGMVDVIGSVMAEVGIAGPWLIERVPVGQSNRVYRVADRVGRTMAVRIGRRLPSRFAAERAAMRAAAEAVVPVPVVRHVGEVDQRGGVVPVMVTDWVDAPSLADAVGSRVEPPRALVRSLAQALARTHSVPVGGFGALDPDLASPYRRLDEWFLDGVHDRVAASHDALRNDPVLGSDPGVRALVDRGVDLLFEHRSVLATSVPTLAHGDFSPDNLLIDLGEPAPSLAIVLDWESAKGGHPGIDFGWWDHVGGAAFVPTEALIAAYEAEVGAVVEHLDVVRRLVRIRILVTEFGWIGTTDPLRSLVPTARALAELIDH